MLVTMTEKNDSSSYKIILVGDGGTGKTSYVARVGREGFYANYCATLGYETTRVLVSTSEGDTSLVLWDTAGQEKTGPLRDHYYQGAHGAILFLDTTSKVTYKNIPEWHKDIRRVCGDDLPVVLFANKVDLNERKVKTKTINYHTKYPNTMVLVEGSVKDRINLHLPVEFLLQRITRKEQLRLKSTLESSLYAAFDALDVE